MTDHCTQCSAVIGDGNADVIYQPYTFFDFSLGEERTLGFVCVSLISTLVRKEDLGVCVCVCFLVM